MRCLAVLLLFVSALLRAQPAPDRDLFAQIDPTMKELEGITGLSPKGPVARDFITRENLKKFLASRIEETVKPEELRLETLTLRVFGFIPSSYNLKEATVNLLTEQAAAFYDYKRKKMFLLEGAPAISQRFVLIHELAHALADQHFALEKFIKAGRNDDSATARMAVMEGQAQWLMYEVIAKKSGQSLRKDPAMVRMFVNASAAGLSEYPELSNSPLYIRESLLFPYTRGLLFQQAVLDKVGDSGFSEVFQRPPAGTREVLHPETYFDRQAPVQVRAPEPRKKRDFKEASAGEFGEFDLYILLKQYTDEETADRLSPAWRGGHYRVYEHKKNQRPGLTAELVFDKTAAAAEFRTLYEQRVLPAKEFQAEGHRLEQTGNRVTIREGIE